MTEKTIVNKVAQSGIVTLDLEELIPDKEEVAIDIKEQLFQGLILKERDFRQWVKDNDWSEYADKCVAVYCSTDAIVPTWAYMLIASALNDYTTHVYFCTPDQLGAVYTERSLASVSPEGYADKRIVIKGCGDRAISNHAYINLTSRLQPYVKTLMFGEPCSTVPVYKKRK
jgi:hypothetical protein